MVQAKRDPVEDLERTFGLLLTCGLHPKQLLTEYSIEQIGVLAGLVVKHKVETMNLFLKPIVEVMGGEWKESTTKETPSRRGKRKSTAPKDRTYRASNYDTDEARENALLGSLFRASGQGRKGSAISLKDVKVSDKTP